jgi:hypothetical protein
MNPEGAPLGLPRRLTIALIAVLAVSLLLAAPATARAAYGAIAIDPGTGAAGISWDHKTKTKAKKRAKRECAGDCRTAVWVRNACAAVVQTPGGGYLAAIGKSKRKAIKKARKGAHAPSAQVVAWVCSG